MKLSVVIVNYNVEHFLDQCLHSVLVAIQNIDGEVFVVDNNSVDGSVKMVCEKYPSVKLIANKENSGFSKANNQAIRVSSGEYVLLLNPDTVIESDTLEKVVAFMDAHPEAGGLGVNMVDGKGNFLPESKRGLPTPAVAFYKIFGLSALFPKSKTFGKYHLGFLDKNKTHEVEILSGAFMLMRKAALDKVGLLDETFFMYGEDIDLSYRLIKGGYKNYYFSGTRIIHYKGESTKKSSANYVFVFYRAMVIFARKHFSGRNAELFSFMINMAIYLRAGMALGYRFISGAALPLLDLSFSVGGLYVLKHLYEENVKNVTHGYYSEDLLAIAFPAYALIWMATVLFTGGYDKPVRLGRVMRGVMAGSALILIVYSLLPEQYRFSRALILLGSIWTLIAMTGLRFALHKSRISKFKLEDTTGKRFLVVGSQEEFIRVRDLLKETAIQPAFTGWVSTQETKSGESLGSFERLEDITRIYQISEIIFCAKDLPSNVIIDQMISLGNSNIDFKIAPPESLSVIGSNSIDTAGDLYVIGTNSVTRPANLRNKRLLDLGLSLTFLAGSPVFIFLEKSPSGFMKNIFRVLSGRRTWVGYGNPKNDSFSSLKQGVLKPSDTVKEQVDPITAEKLNLVYAKNYRVENDLRVIAKKWRELGR